MAEEQQAPIVVRRQKPGEPPAFEQELSGRTDRARAAFQTAHPELFGPPQNTPATETTPLEPPAAVPEPAAPPAELPVPDENAPVPAEETPPAETAQPPKVPTSVPPPAQAPSPTEPQPVPQDTNAIREMRAAIRRLERENRQLIREREAAKNGTAGVVPAPPEPKPAVAASPSVPPAEAQPPPATDDDPFGLKSAVREAVTEVERRYEQRDQERSQRTQQEEARRYEEELSRSEREFAATHPDYFDSVNHIANWERRRYQLSGAAQVKAAEMINDQQWQPVIEKVADEFVFVPGEEGVLMTARRDQLTSDQQLTAREMSDAEAAVCLATDLWIRDRRNDILQGARFQRRSVPEVVWEMATKVAGYQPRQATAPASVPAVRNGSSGAPPPADRIRQQARVNAASRNLSNLSSGTPGEPQQVQIRTLREWSEFQARDPVGARRYLEQMSRVDPYWHRNLGA